MADVNIIPRISCDNCGLTVDKEFRDRTDKAYHKPRSWGSCKIEGSNSDMYGSKDRLDFTDLCPKCAKIAINATSEALKVARGEEDE